MRPVATSQSLMVLSEPPDATVRPSSEKATDKNSPEPPVSVRSSCPLATFQSLMVLSLLARGQCLTIGREGHGDHLIGVSGEGTQLASRLQRPRA